MNKYRRAMVRFFKAQLGKPYKFGARGPEKWDCIGLDVGAAREAGLDSSVFPSSWTVRNLTAWAKANGRLRLVVDGYQPKRGDVFLWGAAALADHKPVKGAGHTGLVLQPVSPEHPKGKAISAYNPEKGVIVHDLIPEGHLAPYGFVELDYPKPEPPPTEIEDSAPDSDAAAEQPDEPPTYDELVEKIKKAQEALA